MPPEGLRRELDSLGTGDVAVVVPDDAAVAVFGQNILDPALWRPAFQAGLAQAPSALESVAEVWAAPRVSGSGDPARR